MKKRPAVLVIISITAFGFFLGLSGTFRDPLVASTAHAQENSPAELFSPEQLDNLLAPIALYPDPLLAQVLLAATFVDQVDEASRWLRAYNSPNAIDNQPWDVSVKAVAHYPSVLYMMSDQLDWTTSLGQAYVYQSTDVMASVQRLRALAQGAGNLVTTKEQEVIVDGDVIAIVPAQTQYIYVPTYDSSMIYFGPASYFGFYPATIIYFGPAFPIGVWLNHACDWHRRRVYYHGWRGSGWIARSRPVIRITNVYVNNYLINVQINRNIVHRRINYLNLNRYNSIHRDVNYSNLIHDKRAKTGNANAGNKIIRRNLDVTNPKLDEYRGRVPAQKPAAREKPPPPAQTKPRPIPAPSTRPPERVRPSTPQPPALIQRPPNTAFGTGEGGFDARAASQRGQESRARVGQPATRPQPVAPRPPASRIPSAPGRR